MIRLVLILFLFSFLLARAQQKKLSVGEIEFDAKTDNPQFQFCNKFVLEGYELKTRDDETRHWISEELKKRFITRNKWNTQTGFITVRFAVNCFGLTDRFRAMGVNAQLYTIDFDDELTRYLIILTKEVKWPVENYRDRPMDYFQDVSFKIVKGELTEVIL